MLSTQGTTKKTHINKTEDPNLMSEKPVFYISSSGLTNLPSSSSYIQYTHLLKTKHWYCMFHYVIFFYFLALFFHLNDFLISASWLLLSHIKTSFLMNHQLTVAILQYNSEYSTHFCTSQTSGHLYRVLKRINFK